MSTKKVIIITGSSSGIGAETAVLFASLGYSVTLTGRDLDNLRIVAKKCKEVGAQENEVLIVQGDLGRKADLESIVNQTVNNFGRIDVLINNGAVYTIKGGLNSVEEDSFALVMKVNVWAAMHLTKLAAPHLIKTKGCVINCSSIYGYPCCPTEYLLYGISKAALIQFTKIAAKELAPAVRVISVSPGHIDTPIYERAGLTLQQKEKYLDYLTKHYPLQRIGESKDVAKTFAFIASNDGTFLTGIDVPIDGGAMISQPVALIFPQQL